MKLKVGDAAVVTAGKDKGREGKIVRVLPVSQRVVVEGVNKYKRHVKPRGKGQPGSIAERERPLPVANVALVCPRCKQPTRVGYQETREGKKIRVCRKCNGEVNTKL